MNLKLILMLVPIVFRMILAVEKIIKELRAGPAKKDTVLGLARMLLTALVKADMIKESDLDDIMGVLSVMVDSVVDLLNSLGVFKHAGEPSTTG